MILAIRTDSPKAELYLLDQTGKQLQAKTWYAGFELSKQLLSEIQTLLGKHKKHMADVTGVLVYQGPGSFTGLRIGISVGNAIAYADNVPIVGTSGKTWLKQGLASLKKQKPGQYVVPSYGREPHITKPKK